MIGRFAELTMALKVMVPDVDVNWVRRPDGATVYSLLPPVRRTLMVPDAGVLFEWGIQMMDKAATRARHIGRLAAYRDGLLIAMLAARGRRLRSMALLRVGHELVRHDDRYQIVLSKDQVKTNKADRFDLPKQLTPYVDHYLNNVRPALLGKQVTKALWVTAYGNSQSEGGIQCRIRRLSKPRFGQSFGPHRFRHAIITTVALRLSRNQDLGSDLLNISPDITERHYNRAGQCRVGARYADLIEGHRRKRR